MVKTNPRIVEDQPELEQDPSKPASESTLESMPALKRDIFDDLSQLSLSQDFVEMAGVKKLLTTVPVRKPNPQEFVRVHPDPMYRRTGVGLLELKEDRETYLVLQAAAEELPGEFFVVTLYTAVSRQGVVFLWPVRLPGADGRILEWHRSAAEAAEKAMTHWVRMKANMGLGAYDIYPAMSTVAEPQWPDVSFNELLRIGFRDRVISNFDHNHPVIKRLLCLD